MRNLFQILVVVVAVLGLGLGAAFGVGTWYGRRTAPEPATSTTASGSAGGTESATAARAAGTGGAPQGGVAPTTGVVEEINGDTVTIRTQAGGTVSVKLAPDTQVQQQAAAAPSDIKPGTTISVTGQPDADGKVAARSVQIGGTGGARPAGAAGPSTTPASGATPGPAGTPPGRAQPSASPGR